MARASAGAAGKVIVFGLLKRGGKVHVLIVPDTKTSMLIWHPERPIPAVPQGMQMALQLSPNTKPLQNSPQNGPNTNYYNLI